ncbi:MAG: glutamate--cysteine ligase, partial [Paracoccaceae bacterium]
MSIPQSGGGLVEHYDQLVQYLSDGCKPRSDWKVGTEHEKFGFFKDTLKPIPYNGKGSVKSLLVGLKDNYGWEPVFEAGNIIGLTKDGANVSLEPGGQLELSGAPLASIHETCDEVNTHLNQVKNIADKLGIGFIGLGAAPTWKHHEMPLMPKGRYRLMTDYMDKVGTMGKTMMYRTCTVQVNLDFESESDMVKKMRVAIALQPVSTALFSNSPFFEGKLTNCKSWRSRVWRDLDASRTGTIPFIFKPTFGFERWVEYALDVPMYFVYRDGKYINALGQ